MSRIGAGWLKTDKNNEYFISCEIDKALQPLTITPDKRLNIYPNKGKESGTKQPDYYLDLYIPTDKNDTVNSEEFPF